MQHARVGPMIRRLPPLNAIRAFEAAGRHLSFTRAADELHVTQGAVSHQVKALEAWLGLPLFRRRPQNLDLTAAGQAYLAVAREALDRLAAGTDQVLAREAAGVLTVSVSPNFAARWLVHRLGRFVRAHPGIDLRVSASLHHVDFAREDVDLVVRHGDGIWPGLHVERLIAEERFPVCSPAYLRDHPLRRPADLLDCTLLHVNEQEDWREWLRVAGADAAALPPGVVFNQRAMAVEAAGNGQGVALGRTALVASDLLGGRLVRPFALGLPARLSYFVVCPKATAERPKIRTFRDWLQAEATDDARRLEALGHMRPASAAS